MIDLAHVEVNFEFLSNSFKKNITRKMEQIRRLKNANLASQN